MTTHVNATSRYVRVAPNQVRQVVAHIRGQRVEQARRVLQVSPKGVAEQVLKTLNSAIANAENNHELDADDLYVTAAVVNEGPMLKRFQPRAMGRAYRIRKRTSHITISVGTSNEPPPRRNRPLEGQRAARAAARGETLTAVPAGKTPEKTSGKTSGKSASKKSASKKTTAKKSTATKSATKKSTAKASDKTADAGEE